MNRNEKLKKFIKSYDLQLSVEWLDVATTHDSYQAINPDKPTNERLETLGDSILDLIAINWLYDNFQNGTEGIYTQLRSEIVSNSLLGKLGKDLGLNSLILRGEGAFINEKQIADALEAIFGAIFKYNQLKKKNSYEICKNTFENFFHQILEDIRFKGFKPNLVNKNQYNPKNQLQEYVLKNKMPKIEVKLINESGPPHQKEFTSQYLIQFSKEIELLATGTASTIKQSEKIAAEKLLRKLKDQKLKARSK